MLTALLVTSAATLFESAPFILAALALTQTPLRWNARMDAYLGCGCGAGPSARSLPAAAATWLVFGPLVAGARLAGAMLIERFSRTGHSCDRDRAASLLSELHLLLPIAALGAAAVSFLPAIAGVHTSRAAAFALGAAAAFVISPCALGSVGLAAAVRSVLPAASAGFLCVAGIFDARAWLHRRSATAAHDAFAYAIVALACAIVAARGGAGLVHPRLALALWPCAIAGAYGAYRFRSVQCAKVRIAPIVMLAGALLAVPPPEYHATETTLGDAFAGERVDFTGMLTRTGDAATLVRYAITCCRADAAPVVIRLLHAPPSAAHGWMHARGALVARGNDLRLRTDTLTAIAPPADPFVYR
ncbi:MAG TPA: hypothetical protein VJP85_06900 [Candidatus Baltobacteraceae bacterium]|nr:hypothetical protein [Candidatus Baltobacteraceae bacterium]